MESTTPRRRAKRANNTGSVYYVASENRYRAQFYDQNGKLRQLSGKAEQDVVARLDQAIKARDTGMLGPAPGQTPTVGEWMDSWLAAKYELKPKTVERYRTDIDRFIKPFLGDVRLDQLRAPMLDTLYARLRNELGLAPSTVKHVHSTLSSALRQAFVYDVLPSPIMSKVRAPKVPVVERKIIPEVTVRQILQEASVRGIQQHLRWRLALLWGLRQGEALGLRWQDVDLVTGTVSVRQQLQYFAGEGMKVGTPKAAASSRHFVVDPETLSALKTHRKEQAARTLAASRWEPGDLVFCTEQGRPIDTSNDRRQFKRLLRAVEGGDFRVHDARHTAITNMVMDGTPLAVVQRVSGHSDIRTTISYVHLTGEAFEAAAAGVARRFAQEQGRRSAPL